MEASKSYPHFATELEEFFPNSASGTLGENQVNSDFYLKHNHFSTTTDLAELIFDSSLTEPAGLKMMHALSFDEFQTLSQTYEMLLMNSNYFVHHFGSLCYKFNRIKFGSQLLSSKLAKSDRSSYIYAMWNTNSTDQHSYRAGCIEFFLQHEVILKQGEDEILIKPTLAFINHIQRGIIFFLQ